jgi:type IV pilus assembly protein PilE
MMSRAHRAGAGRNQTADTMMTTQIGKGFTLIEVMITVALVAILATIAYPSFRDQLIRARRSDGQIALVQAAAAQERWFTANNSYTNAIGNIGGAGSPEGYYTLAVTIPGDAGCTVGAKFYCFEVTATPTTLGGQNGDSACATIKIDHKGQKTSTGGGTRCWD